MESGSRSFPQPARSPSGARATSRYLTRRSEEGTSQSRGARTAPSSSPISAAPTGRRSPALGIAAPLDLVDTLDLALAGVVPCRVVRRDASSVRVECGGSVWIASFDRDVALGPFHLRLGEDERVACDGRSLARGDAIERAGAKLCVPFD